MAKSQRQRSSSGGAGRGGHDPELVGLIERSGFIFIGRAGREKGGRAANEQGGRTANEEGRRTANEEGGGTTNEEGVLIEEVLLSIEALRGLAGQQASFIQGEQGRRAERGHQEPVHHQAVFFSNIISLGGDIVLRLEAEAEAGESQVANIREHIRYV